ncbi:hypothetical protein GCM10025867_37280 [Frondihabitans sucicola]|uniref:HMA domain-containing protein n=1 Tax=Frondihabitans sucicola TaxID=1268041 RepID=A0ABN6Y2B6_9MICO|nr:heavy-metal-associated domain-containing protein [Frondihabitans sucicola]BDZ51487.1 hypothetical protein GCM10025867_37280 [Frondihabitans sucicola]
MSTATYLIDGMTCEHCVNAVTTELGALGGVERVAVDLKPGASSAVTVTSVAPLDPALVDAAVDEAGYAVHS